MKQRLQDIIKGEVYTDPIRTGLLSTDASIFRVTPLAVVYPACVEDVVQTVRFASAHQTPIHPRGAGSGLCGSALGNGIVLDFSKYMNRLLHLNIEENWMECEPGYRGGELSEALKGSGLFFPPDPSSAEYASFGGMYGTNASGAHSVKYGNVSDYILDAQVVLSTGQLINLSDIFNTAYENLSEPFQKILDIFIRHQTEIDTAYPPIRCNTTGYNLRNMVKNGKLELTRLFAGAEGTLGIVTRLKFRLVPKPPHDALVVAFFEDIATAVRAVQQILPLKPSGIEIMDKSLLNLAKRQDARLKDRVPDGIDNVLLIEFDAHMPEVCTSLAEQTCRILVEGNHTDAFHPAITQQEKDNFWAIRKAAVPILYRLNGRKKILPLIEDAAVPTDRLPEYFQGIYDILSRHGVSFVVYGHIAKGLLHTRPLLDLKAPEDIRLLKPIADDVFNLVHSLNGAISGEHGDGRLRSAYIQRQYPTLYPLFQEVRSILDPQGLMNPDILVSDNPRLMRQHLRYGADYHTNDIPQKGLLWPEGFTDAVEVCHGCSRCTTVTGATRMCPVYKITRDEAAAPKAKANILRLLISSAIDDRNLYDTEFQKVMSWCVQCGSCHHECPSGVSIPKLAIEAKRAYHRRYGAPLQDRLTANTEQAGKFWHSLFRHIPPSAANIILERTGAPLLGHPLPHVSLLSATPSFHAPVTPATDTGSPKILYFTGCYAAYFGHAIYRAVISVLSSMDMVVYTPPQHCCGLPMISKAMIPEAKNKIEENFQRWGNLLDSVDYIAVSCSSCGLTLMKEWPYIDNTVFTRKVRQKLIHVSTLIHRYSSRLQLESCNRRIFYHMPCHLKIQPDADCSLQMLADLKGIQIDKPTTNCCGMAGTWGLSGEHRQLSLDIGSDLRRKLTRTSADIAVTDCPTCAIQMSRFTRLPIRHPIEIIAEHLDGCFT